MKKKPLIIYKDRQGNIIATVDAPPHVVVFNSIIQIVDNPKDFKVELEIVGIGLYQPEEKKDHIRRYNGRDWHFSRLN